MAVDESERKVNGRGMEKKVEHEDAKQLKEWEVNEKRNGGHRL